MAKPAPKLKFADALQRVRDLGFTLSRKEGGYRLAPVGGTPQQREEQAYYTDDLRDAVSTARFEHGRRVSHDFAILGLDHSHTAGVAMLVGSDIASSHFTNAAHRAQDAKAFEGCATIGDYARAFLRYQLDSLERLMGSATIPEADARAEGHKPSIDVYAIRDRILAGGYTPDQAVAGIRYATEQGAEDAAEGFVLAMSRILYTDKDLAEGLRYVGGGTV